MRRIFPGPRSAPATLIAALAILASGCDNDLPVASFVDKLRVLAVKAEPPEVAPGDHTKLSVLAVEPAQPAQPVAPLSALWLACLIPPGVTTPLPCGLDPGAPLGVALPTACGDSVDGQLCVLSTALEADLRPAKNILGSATSATLLITVVVADTGGGAGACLLDTARNGGVPTAPDHCVISIKRVTVRDPLVGTTAEPAGPPNHNPTLSRFDLVDADGTVRSLLTGDAILPVAATKDAVTRTLTTLRTEDAAEQKADGTFEALSLSWFTTGGKIDGGRSTFDPPGCTSQDECAKQQPVTGASTSWNAPTAASAALETDPNGQLRFWAVLRDDRGGVGWLAGSLAVH